MKINSLINKQHLLSENYIPNDLFTTDQNEFNFHKYKNEALKPQISIKILPYFLAMQYYAYMNGFNIIIDSGYRSFNYQQVIWDKNVLEQGLEKTKQFVAPPGSSEHQSGLAFDIAYLKGPSLSYDDTVLESDEEVKWLIENAHYFGFILRYPKGKEKITGYKPEPWHYRFVGVPLATILKKHAITLEEYYQNLKKYKPSVEAEKEPMFITELEMYAAILYVKNDLDNIDIADVLNKYQRLLPNMEVIPMVPHLKDSLLKGLGELSKEQLQMLAKNELIHFIETYCFLGR